MLSAVVAAFVLAWLGVRFWASGLVSHCAVCHGDAYSGVLARRPVRRKNTGTGFPYRLIGLVARNKRRYGGYIVHLGVVLIFLGFAGNAYKRDTQVLLKLGEQTTPEAIRSVNDVKISDDGQKQMATAYISVFEDGKQIDTLYRLAGFSASTSRSRRLRSLSADRLPKTSTWYLRSTASKLGSQSATLQIVINPLVNWIWLGFGIMALGTGIALLPERIIPFALALGAEATSTAAALSLLILVFAGTPVLAQQCHEGSSESVQAPYARTELERQLRHEIVYACPTCGHASIGECRKDPCPVSHKLRGARSPRSSTRENRTTRSSRPW